MTTNQYLAELRSHLNGLPASEIEDIIRDQQEYIREATQAGRTESDVIQGLGDPKAFAANMKAESKIQQAQLSVGLNTQFQNTARAVLAFLALAPLNFIFILGPFLALCGVILAGWATSLAVFGAAIVLFGAFFFMMVTMPVGFWIHLSTFFFIAGCLGLGLIGILLMITISQGVLNGTLTYLRWNLNIIKSQASMKGA